VIVRAWLGHLLRGLAVVVVLLAAVGGGIGWLYALRHLHVLNVGPKLTDALPLQRLAGGAAQPLGRIVAAWLPTGIAAGFALAVIAPLGRAVRAAVAFVLALGFAIAIAAGSDALTHNEPLRSHLHEQPHRVAIWVAAGLIALGTLVAPGTGRGAGRHAP
jgi:hypothetical protein